MNAFSGFLRGIALVAALAVCGCATKGSYTSLDLDLLPCESGDSPKFFHSIEFDADGAQRYPSQLQAIEERYRKRVTDVVVFVHGWNKNPTSAERDYQDFLCRLHGKMRDDIGDQKRKGGLLVIGVFWPSTISNRPRDPLLLKPVSYFTIRDRADHIARTGMYRLLHRIGELNERQSSGTPVRVQLIGHSFGARMTVAALEKLDRDGLLSGFLQSAGSTNVMLLNAAVAPDRFLWIPDTIRLSGKGAARSGDAPQTSYLFNVHSYNDSATRRLFPLASLFNDEPATCAAGACGVPQFVTIPLNEAGELVVSEAGCRNASRRINAWNIDATQVVFSHTDIYKGRIATLISRLAYDEAMKAELPGGDCS